MVLWLKRWSIRMSHWRQQMVDGTEHLISCDWLAFLSVFSHLQLIQNSAPSTICWCHCDIWIGLKSFSPFQSQNRIYRVCFSCGTLCLLKIAGVTNLATYQTWFSYNFHQFFSEWFIKKIKYNKINTGTDGSDKWINIYQGSNFIWQK